MTRIWRFITGLFGQEQDAPLYGKIALPLVIVGVALMAPGWRDAALSYLNKTYSLGLSLDAPWWVGAASAVIGVVVFLIGFVTASLKPPGQFIAIHHQSFQPLTSPLPNDALPRKMRKRKMSTLECDQSNFLSGGAFDPIGAVRQQQRLAQDVAAIRKADSNAALGYYGIVQIRTEIAGLIRRAELILAKLFDLELLFQPSTLHAICQHAEKAVPRQKRYFAGLMKLSTRNVFIEMPENFTVPSSRPIEALQAAIAGAVPVANAQGPAIVYISGTPCAVSTRQKSNSAWVASGNYSGMQHTAEDRTEGEALKRWQEWAIYRARA